MKQLGLGEMGYEKRPKTTKLQRFLSEMEAVVSWAACAR
jgi:hypothetical protein